MPDLLYFFALTHPGLGIDTAQNKKNGTLKMPFYFTAVT